MPMTRNILPEEVRKAKLLLGKGLSETEVASILGRSVSAVIKIRNGAYNFLLAECQDDAPEDGRVDILLKSIDSRLYRQNEDMKKTIEALASMSKIIMDLSREINVGLSCLSMMSDSMKDLTEDLKRQSLPQAVPESPTNKCPGKDFEKWGEVIRRVDVYGDKFIADSLRGTKASLDGTTLYLACTPSTKKFLKSSAVAIPRIKQQCRNVIGYGVEVKIIDL